MLALATFFPTADNVGEEGFDLFGVRYQRIIRFLSKQSSAIKSCNLIISIYIIMFKNTRHIESLFFVLSYNNAMDLHIQ